MSFRHQAFAIVWGLASLMRNVVEENINYLAGKRAEETEGARTADAVPNDHSPPHSVLHHAALRLETEEYSLSAPDDEAELMRWHYRLGHASFAKLRQLALHGEIPKKLANICPPKCAVYFWP